MRTVGMRKECRQLLILFVFVCTTSSTSNGGTDKNQQTFVVRYKNGDQTIPVTVVLDFKKQTEYVINLSPRASTKTVTLYDFKQRTIAYKDLTNRECFLGRLTYETLNEETDALSKVQNPVEHQPKVLTLDPQRGSLTPTEIRNVAGQKTAVFCRKMNTWLVLSTTAHRLQKREVDEDEERTFHRQGYHTVHYSHYGRETRKKYKSPRSNSSTHLSHVNGGASRNSAGQWQNPSNPENFLPVSNSSFHENFPEIGNDANGLLENSLERTSLDTSSRNNPLFHNTFHPNQNSDFEVPPDNGYDKNIQNRYEAHSNFDSDLHTKPNRQRGIHFNDKASLTLQENAPFPSNADLTNSEGPDPIELQPSVYPAGDQDEKNSHYNSALYRSEIIEPQEYLSEKKHHRTRKKDQTTLNEIESELFPEGHDLSKVQKNSPFNFSDENEKSIDPDVSINILEIPKRTGSFEKFSQSDDIHDLFQGFHNLGKISISNQDNYSNAQLSEIDSFENANHSRGISLNTVINSTNENTLSHRNPHFNAAAPLTFAIETTSIGVSATTNSYDDSGKIPTTLFTTSDDLSNTVSPVNRDPNSKDRHRNHSFRRNNVPASKLYQTDSLQDVTKRYYTTRIPESELSRNTILRADIPSEEDHDERNNMHNPSPPTSNTYRGATHHQIRYQNILRHHKPDEIVIDIEKLPAGPVPESTDAFQNHHSNVESQPNRVPPFASINYDRIKHEQRTGPTWRRGQVPNPQHQDRYLDSLRTHHYRNGFRIAPRINPEPWPTESNDFSNWQRHNLHQTLHNRPHKGQSNHLRTNHQLDNLPPGVSIHPRHPNAPYADMFRSNMPPPVPQESGRVASKPHRQRHHRKKDKTANSCCRRSNPQSSCCRSQDPQVHMYDGRVVPSDAPCCSTPTRSGRRRQVPQHRKKSISNREQPSQEPKTLDARRERCMQEKMCRTLYESTQQVMVCRNAEIEGC